MARRSIVRRSGTVDGEMVDRDLVAVAADEDADASAREGAVCLHRDIGAVDREAQRATNRSNRELVCGGVHFDGVRMLPGQQVDPVIRFAPPDANLTLVARLENVVATILAGAVARARVLVSHDDPVATA